MSPFGPPGFGAQWSEESVELARQRDEQLLAEAEYRQTTPASRPRGAVGALTRAWRRLFGRTPRQDSAPPES